VALVLEATTEKLQGGQDSNVSEGGAQGVHSFPVIAGLLEKEGRDSRDLWTIWKKGTEIEVRPKAGGARPEEVKWSSRPREDVFLLSRRREKKSVREKRTASSHQRKKSQTHS